jgi:hypothetical protein
MNKIIIIAMSALMISAPLMAQGQNLERMRKSAEDINIDTSSLKKSKAAKVNGKYEIEPTAAKPTQVSTNPIEGLVKAIATLLKLLFSPNGDIEIANPPTDVPQVEGTLDDDQSEETYDAGASYTPLQPADYQDSPAAQQPNGSYQQFQQPQAQQFQEFLHGPQAGGTRSGEIPEDLKRKALEYFNANPDKIKNRRYIGIIDFAAHSSKVRFFILNVETNEVHAMHVAHGSGSDPDGDGFANRFSNVPNSKASSLGFYMTGALYNGSHGKSMRLHGLSSTNSNALSRAVVIHESAYVREANVRQGRSFGCPAVAQSEIRRVLSSLNGGALIYAGLSNSEF